jgi:formylglycine-generating enzyme required for sulfatase activity
MIASNAGNSAATQTAIAAVQPTPLATRPTVTFTPRPVATTPLPVPPATSPPGLGATRIAEKDGMVMVYVPAGEFTMGSTDADIDAILASCKDCERENYTDEQPPHKVYLDAFWIDRTEVTNAQYKQCVQTQKCKASSYADNSTYNGDNQPVVGVDWNDAQSYCEWAGRQLPTEAQWEKAARGMDGRIHPWGNQAATCDYGVMDDDSGIGCGKGNSAWPVGSKSKGNSPYGAWDMAGNVWEWVADWYDEKYYANSPARNPSGPTSGEWRVLRGGGSSNDWYNVRAACRSNLTAADRVSSVGFRCVVVAPGQ